MAKKTKTTKEQVVKLQRVSDAKIKTDFSLQHAKNLLSKSKQWEIAPESEYELTPNGDIARKSDTGTGKE